MFYTCIVGRTYKIIRLKNVKRQSLSQRHPKREDVVAVTGDRRIIKLEGRGPNPAICPRFASRTMHYANFTSCVVFVYGETVLQDAAGSSVSDPDSTLPKIGADGDSTCCLPMTPF